MTPMQYGNPAGAGSRIRRMDREDSYLVHIDRESDFLVHYGVKGQKWGVITKEYEPVAVDHRKTRFRNPVSKIRNHYREKDARQMAKDKQMRAERQAWLEKKNRRLKTAGTVLGASVLALSLFGGYKLSHIKFDGGKALNSLLGIIPKKGDRMAAIGRTVNKGFLASMAREQTSSSGLNKVKQTFARAGGLLTGQRYKQHLKRVRDLIGRYRNSSI